MINFAAICPHPLVLAPELKNSDKNLLQKTSKSIEALASDLRKTSPDIIIIISSQGPMRYDKFTMNFDSSFYGNFIDFGGDDFDYTFNNDRELSKKILRYMRKKHAPLDIIRESNLDYGSLIPLIHLTKDLDKKPKVIPLTFTATNWNAQFKFGKQLGTVLEESAKNIAIIASIHLSNRLTEEAPAGFSPYGIKYDSTLIKLLQENEVDKIKALNPEFCEEAGEGGLQAILITLGAIAHSRYAFHQLSYENPLGVGYLVGEWNIK